MGRREERDGGGGEVGVGVGGVWNGGGRMGETGLDFGVQGASGGGGWVGGL